MNVLETAGSTGSPFSDGPSAPQLGARLVAIMSIRTDGQTQHRAAADPAVVAEYGELMREGVVFPPISIWSDGQHHWVSDGFQRLAAAVGAGMTEILAEVRPGTLEDAQWHSYVANAVHGARLSSAERQRIVGLALKHTHSSGMSDLQLAEYLHLPRTTFRRWRQELSWPNGQGEGGVKIVARGGKPYALATANIGKHAGPRPEKARRDLRAELAEMKASSSTAARRLLNIFEHWVCGQSKPAQCLYAIEQVVGERPAKAGTA